MQKLSIIKFKPKPGCLDEFAANLSAYGPPRVNLSSLCQINDDYRRSKSALAVAVPTYLDHGLP